MIQKRMYNDIEFKRKSDENVVIEHILIAYDQRHGLKMYLIFTVVYALIFLQLLHSGDFLPLSPALKVIEDRCDICTRREQQIGAQKGLSKIDARYCRT